MKVNFKKSFTFALGLLIAACNPQTAQAPLTTGTPQMPVITATEQAPVATVAPVPLVPATPLSLVRLEDRLLASINSNEHPLASPNMFGNHPEEIVFANGFVWIHLVNGHLVQVDPSTNSMVSAIKTDTTSVPQDHYCQGLGTDGKDIWICSASGDEDHKTIDVVRVDPSTQSVVATFEIGKIFDQLYMPFVQNQIWVLTGDGTKLVGIDVSNNQPSPAIDLGTRCFQLAILDNTLLATCGLDNLVIKIDPEKKEVIAQQTLQGPGFIAAAKNGIWVSQGNSVTRLDPESLNPIVTITGITPSDIHATEDAVWVWEYGKGILYKIDPTKNEVVEQIKPDKPFISGGGVLPTSDSIWLTVDENNLLLRLSLK
jgi:hypothetical protein